MAALVATVSVAQLARSVNDITRACASAGVATIAREGASQDVLGFLAASTAELLPNVILIDGLSVSQALEGTWTSPFMANFMGVQQGTMQQALLKVNAGKKLVLYATALAAATTAVTVRGILKEHLAIALGLSEVAEVPENIYHVCVHSPTLHILQQDTASNLERCTAAFSATDTGKSRAASRRELAGIAIAFATAQKKGPKYWVRVKNLIGVEALCAALGTAFIADITVGSIKTISHTNILMDISNQSEAPPDSAMSTTTPTLIHFEYDTSGVVSVGICQIGAPVRTYVFPEGGEGSLSRNSMLGGEILALAKITLDHDYGLHWICKGAMGAYAMRRLAREMIDELGKDQDETRKAMAGRIMSRWIETFVKETGGTQADNKMMGNLLAIVAIPDMNEQRFARKVELLAGPDHAATVSRTLHNTDASNAIYRTLFLSLFKALFGLSYTGLELNLDSLSLFHFPSNFNLLIPHVFNILPAYDVCVTTHRNFSRCCSVVQCGGYALMPRILAEKEIGDIDSSPFIMVPGHIAMNGVPVKGFFYDEQHGETQIDAIRPEAPVPSNAGDSDVIDYVYEQADYGYKFWTIEAGHRLNLDGLVEGILFMHKADDSYDDRATLTPWQRAAPHHMVLHALQKTVYLAYGNVAGRRLALSRAGTASSIAVVHTGRDYGRALAYANRYECGAVIL